MLNTAGQKTNNNLIVWLIDLVFPAFNGYRPIFSAIIWNLNFEMNLVGGYEDISHPYHGLLARLFILVWVNPGTVGNIQVRSTDIPLVVYLDRKSVV